MDGNILNSRGARGGVVGGEEPWLQGRGALSDQRQQDQ